VAGDGVEPKLVKILVDYKGNWQAIDAQPDK
jgi:hypothetical protein